MSSTIPVPGAEDLFPHVAQLVDPGNEMDGEMIVRPRVLGLLMAPSVEEFLEVWERQEDTIKAGIAGGSFDYPSEWERGLTRRSKELQARYNSTEMLTILRGLHRDYGVLPQGV